MSCCHTEETCHTPSKSKPDLLFWGSLVAVAFLLIIAFVEPIFLASSPRLAIMAHGTHHLMSAMWPGLVAGAIFSGLLSKVPREFVVSILGRGGTFSGLLRATGAGVLLDLCSHGILMIGVKLYERGASAGQVIAFLLASPWNSFSLTFILVSLIGLKWTIAFILLSMLIALITGWLFDRCVSAGILPKNPNHVSLPEHFAFWPEARAQFSTARFDRAMFKSMSISGLKDAKMVARWLLFGVVLATAIRAFLDPSLYEQFFGPTGLGLAVTIAVATVLEVCSEGSTPIAADILTRAKSPGNSFAFLMAGVSTDYTEIMILKDASKSWKFALFLPLITVPQVLIVAWLLNSAM